jgi:hypothetical protein
LRYGHKWRGDRAPRRIQLSSRQLKQGLAGLVAVGDLSRANRRAKDQFELFDYCRIFNVALWYDERMHDARDINELLTMQMTAVSTRAVTCGGGPTR